jgi:hypothetical protein
MLSDLMTKEKRTVVGLTEKVKILSNGKSKQIVARIDTGCDDE